MAGLRCVGCARCLGCVLVALLSIAGPGCYESAFPIDDAPQAELDPRILGGWRCMFAEPDGNDVFAMEIKPSGDRQYRATTMVAGGDLGRFQVHVSTLNGRPVVNVRSLQAEPGEKPWMFLRYDFLKPNVLHVQAIRDDAFDTSPGSGQAVRKTLEQVKDEGEIYEDAFVCLRLK